MRTVKPYELLEDHEEGFKTAVKNNQVGLALQYLVLMISERDKDIAMLKEELANLRNALEEKPKTRKPVKSSQESK